MRLPMNAVCLKLLSQPLPATPCLIVIRGLTSQEIGYCGVTSIVGDEALLHPH